MEITNKSARLVVALVQRMISLHEREDGQTLAEYAMIIGLVALVAVLALIFLGGQISGIFSDVGTHL